MDFTLIKPSILIEFKNDHDALCKMFSELIAPIKDVEIQRKVIGELKLNKTGRGELGFEILGVNYFINFETKFETQENWRNPQGVGIVTLWKEDSVTGNPSEIFEFKIYLDGTIPKLQNFGQPQNRLDYSILNAIVSAAVVERTMVLKP